MSHKKRTQTPEYQWEQILLDTYHDYRWWQILDPLYQKFQQWKVGELDHIDMDEAIHRTYKPRQDINGFFTLKQEILVRAIQLNEEWFNAWVKDNSPPAGYKLG